MGKFHLKKPRIITKHFPEVETHIDKVNSSLETLVFAYDQRIEKALQKKHVMMALSTLALVIVIGSFIAPTGKADVAVFHPETCLGGWSNPRYAENERQTTSNTLDAEFNNKNSAILMQNEQKDMYCGSFRGEFSEATTPKKIIVSLAITSKNEITESNSIPLGDIEGSLVSPSATSTELLMASSSSDSTSSSSLEVATSAPAVSDSEQQATSSLPSTEQAPSVIDVIVTGVANTISNIFNSGIPASSDTDTIVVPSVTPTVEEVPAPAVEQAPVPAPTEEVSPSSYNGETLSPFGYVSEKIKISLLSFFATPVLAQEADVVPVTLQINENETATQGTSESATSATTPTPTPITTPATSSEANTSLSDELNDNTSSSSTTLTSGEEVSSTATSTVGDSLSASSSLMSTFSETIPQAVIETTHQNEGDELFLEVLYTFDGTTWESLGLLNEISMKYRTFEIPLSASSTWKDMSQLQIKVAARERVKQTPFVYLDAIKVEVVYDGEGKYMHPDFSRDTILKDETISDMRIVTLINHENNEEEIWYMYLDSTSVSSSTVTETASSTVENLTIHASSSLITSTSSLVDASSSNTDGQATSSENGVASSTESLIIATGTQEVIEASATTTTRIVPSIQKNKWYKLEKRDRVINKIGEELVNEIKKIDKELIEKKAKEDRLPDFAKDVIKRIKGALLNAVIVQVEKDGKEELWLYDLESGKQQKIEGASSTAITVAKDMQIGVKDTHLFWLSEDRSKVYAFNLVDKSIQAAEVPPHDATIGERGRVSFSGIAWEVIVGSDNFAFYSEATGEVFSDDDSSLSEALRQRFNFDSILDVETIGNLNMSVTATTTE